MPCTVAKHAGFCMGVRQAVEKAERAAAQAQERGIPCYSLGEVVHNPLVTSRLQQLGVQVVERVEDARGGLLILRSPVLPLAKFLFLPTSSPVRLLPLN